MEKSVARTSLHFLQIPDFDTRVMTHAWRTAEGANDSRWKVGHSFLWWCSKVQQ